MITSRRILLKTRKCSDQIYRENQNEYFDFNFPPPPREIVPFVRLCVKIWNSQTGNRCQYETAHALCVQDNKSKTTHSEYVILTDFPLQQWLRECASLLRSTYTGCLSQDLNKPQISEQ